MVSLYFKNTLYVSYTERKEPNVLTDRIFVVGMGREYGEESFLLCQQKTCFGKLDGVALLVEDSPLVTRPQILIHPLKS